MIYIGIDPAITDTGIVVLDEKLAVLSSASIKDHIGASKNRRLEPARLTDMVDRVCGYVWGAMMKDTTAILAIEEPFVGANAAGSLKQYAVFAATVNVLWNGDNLRLLTVSPAAIKKFVGAKKKMFVAREVLRRWNFTSDNHNVVDAYVIAHWAASQDV